MNLCYRSEMKPAIILTVVCFTVNSAIPWPKWNNRNFNNAGIVKELHDLRNIIEDILKKIAEHARRLTILEAPRMYY